MATVLIVDDEEMLRGMLRQALKKDGYDILEASNGNEALELSNTHEIDLLITDLVMPGKNGLDLIMELKKGQHNMPIIAISGGGGIDTNYDYLSVARLIGATSIFSKPIDLGQFRNTVSNLLKSKT